jgi:hypothetical protein
MTAHQWNKIPFDYKLQQRCNRYHLIAKKILRIMDRGKNSTLHTNQRRKFVKCSIITYLIIPYWSFTNIAIMKILKLQLGFSMKMP